MSSEAPEKKIFSVEQKEAWNRDLAKFFCYACGDLLKKGDKRVLGEHPFCSECCDALLPIYEEALKVDDQ